MGVCACGTPLIVCECGFDRCPRCDPGEKCPNIVEVPDFVSRDPIPQVDRERAAKFVREQGWTK